MRIVDENRRSSTSGTAVLVVDVQDAAVALGPYCGDVVIDNIAKLIAASRAAGGWVWLGRNGNI